MRLGSRRLITILALLAVLQACMSKEQQKPLLIGSWKGGNDEGSWCFTLREDATIRILNVGYANNTTGNYTLESTGSWEIVDGGRLRFRLSQHNFAEGYSNRATPQNPNVNNSVNAQANDKIIKYNIRRLTQNELSYHERSGSNIGPLQVSERTQQCDFKGLTLGFGLRTTSPAIARKSG